MSPSQSRSYRGSVSESRQGVCAGFDAVAKKKDRFDAVLLSAPCVLFPFDDFDFPIITDQCIVMPIAFQISLVESTSICRSRDKEE